MRTVRLGDIAAIERKGVHPDDLDPETWFLGLEHIERGGRLIGRDTVQGATLTSAKFLFGPEHVLLGKLRPNLGKVARPDFPGVCSTDILPIRPGAELDRSYLAQYLATPRMVGFAASRATGANLPRLSPMVLEAFPVPLPTLEEQRRIAAILDHADTVLVKRRQLLDYLDDLTQSIFHDHFGESEAPTVPLSDLASVSSGITKGRKTSDPTRSVPYLAVSNVQAGSLKLDVVKSIEATDREISRYALADGDLVLTEGGDPDKLGRGTVWRSELPLALHQNHVFRVRPREGVLPDYLAAYLASPAARYYFRRSAKQTTGIASINMTQLKAAPIAVPSIQEQEKFVTRLVSLRRLAVKFQRSQFDHQELLAALQSRAFRGEL